MPNPSFSTLVDRVAVLAKELDDLKEEVRKLRFALYTFGLGLVSAAILFFLAISLTHR